MLVLQNCIGMGQPVNGVRKAEKFLLPQCEWTSLKARPQWPRMRRLHSKWIPINPSLSDGWQYFSSVLTTGDTGACTPWFMRELGCNFNEFEFCQYSGGDPSSPQKYSIFLNHCCLENRLWFSWSNIECSDFAMTAWRELAMQAYIGITFHFKI